jgi:putative tricarboxylic transport membrane protein
MLLVYAALFEIAGFVLATFVLLLLLMLFIDPVRPDVAVGLSILAPLGIWFVVTKWLKIQMPAGVLAAWLG